MRPLEIALLASELLLFSVLLSTSLRAWRWMRFLPFMGIVLAAAQSLLEGPRWQLVPAYALSVAFPLVSVLQRWRRDRKKTPRPLARRIVAGLGVSLGGLALGLAAALPALLPVFHFPPPTGPYGIGTVTYHWVDSSRPDIFAPAPGNSRELMAQVWYPAQRDQVPQRAPYVAPGTNFAALTRLVHLPSPRRCVTSTQRERHEYSAAPRREPGDCRSSSASACPRVV
jgi:hypothetical protein